VEPQGLHLFSDGANRVAIIPVVKDPVREIVVEDEDARTAFFVGTLRPQPVVATEAMVFEVGAIAVTGSGQKYAVTIEFTC